MTDAPRIQATADDLRARLVITRGELAEADRVKDIMATDLANTRHMLTAMTKLARYYGASETEITAIFERYRKER